MFPPGTSADMVLPDGTRRQLTSLSVRATEFTVGVNGLATMPAELPPASGYTYAVDMSVDQAVLAGAKQVVFSQPVPIYVDDFLDFPVGQVVPVGYYDPDQGAWVASPNGRIVEVLSVTGGMADLDVDGSGTARERDTLADLGVTDGERAELASLYAPGAKPLARAREPLQPDRRRTGRTASRPARRPPNTAEQPAAEARLRLGLARVDHRLRVAGARRGDPDRRDAV